MSEDRVERFRALSERDPDNPLHAFAYAQALLREERFEDATAAFRRCLELEPDWMMAAIRLGRCLIELERWDEARAALERGAELATRLGHDEPFGEIRALRELLPG